MAALRRLAGRRLTRKPGSDYRFGQSPIGLGTLGAVLPDGAPGRNLSPTEGVAAGASLERQRVEPNTKKKKGIQMKGMPELCGLVAVLVAGCATTGSVQSGDPGGPMAVGADAQPEPAADAQPEPAVDVQPEPSVGATIWDGVYTAEQADRGADTARTVCFACHSASEWTTPMFIRVWSGRPIHQMWENLRMTMPYDSPGRLTAQEYADVVAYMLELNDVPVGDTELPSDADGLRRIRVTTRD